MRPICFIKLVLQVIAFMAAALPLFSCSTAPLADGEVVVSAIELNREISKQFPVQRIMGSILQVTLSSPRVILMDSTNVAAVIFDTKVRLPFVNEFVAGTLQVSGRLEYISQAQAIYLRDVEVISISLDTRFDQPREGFTQPLSAELGQAALRAAEDALTHKSFYAFAVDNLKKHGLGHGNEQLIVRAEGLILRDSKLISKKEY